MLARSAVIQDSFCDCITRIKCQSEAWRDGPGAQATAGELKRPLECARTAGKRIWRQLGEVGTERKKLPAAWQSLSMADMDLVRWRMEVLVRPALQAHIAATYLVEGSRVAKAYLAMRAAWG